MSPVSPEEAYGPVGLPNADVAKDSIAAFRATGGHLERWDRFLKLVHEESSDEG